METTTPITAAAVTDQFLTVGEVAKMLRVSGMTVYTLIHEGRLEANRIGRRQIRISWDAYRAYIASTRTTDTQAASAA